MNIHEYQSKELMQKHGIKTLNGKVAKSVDDAVAVAQELGGNVWVVNPNCESFVNEEGNHNNRPIAVQLSGRDEWIHINDYDDDYYLPQSITFSKNNILWVSYRFFQKEDLSIYSKGGLRLVDYNVINDEKDDIWYDVDLYDYENFATIGGISSDSVLVKSATDLIGINPITFDVKESPTKLVENINFSRRFLL